MNRTVISPHKKPQQEATTKKGPKDTSDNPNDTESIRNRKSVVVASLAVDRSHSSQSYSSLALSPKGRYALVAGKGTIQLVTVGPDGLKTLRSMKIAHHFYNTSPSSPSTASTNINQQQHRDVRGAFQLSVETRASAVTAGVANMNMNMNQQYGNFIVTKVAWSNNFYYSTSSPIRHNSTRGSQRGSQRGTMVGGSSLAADLGLDESSRSINNINAEIYDQSKHQKGRRRLIRQDQKISEDEEGNVADSLADESMKEDDSLVAAAGSNGVVIVWSAKRLLFSDSGKAPATKTGGRFISAKSSSSASAAFLAEKQRMQQPEGVLNQHTRAVNGMAWHPTRSGLLLTASQDGTIKLWERRVLARSGEGSIEETNDKKFQEQSQSQRSWFSMMGGVVGGGSRTGGRGSLSMDDDSDNARKYKWGCKTTFSLGEQDAIRDIRWSKLIPDVFGVVTSNGNLVVYNMHVSVKALVKIAAHTGDAASLDWHPRWPFVVATGGSSDRFVKIWDLESSLASVVNTTRQRKDVQHHRKEIQQYHNENSNTFDTSKSDTSSYSASSNDSLHSNAGVSSVSSHGPSIRETVIRSTSSIWPTSGRNNKSTTSAFSKHVLSISASVTQVRWRPPSNDFVPSSGTTVNGLRGTKNDVNKEETVVDRHDTMLAVVTARQTSAGGSGTLSLWSFNRPFMSLSIVEGHKEGAISDFVWIKTPQVIPKATTSRFESNKRLLPDSSRSNSARLRKKGGLSTMDESSIAARDLSHREYEQAGDFPNVSYIWQNVLSVGRDGQCIMQSFARGERRIRSVPSSCFAMANLSPFQKGFGSLQLFSVHQDVPNRAEDDFMLTGLRQDEHTAKAPGIFFEEDVYELGVERKNKEEQDFGNRFPSQIPKLSFSVVDSGNLDRNGMPIVNDESAPFIAPEVLHMSRFARLYKMYPDVDYPTRLELCLYNSKVADELKCGPLAQMWKTISSLLSGSGLEELAAINPSRPANAFQFVIFRTVKSLLFERAEAGDVQTNVVLCEVLQVVDSSGERTHIPGLDIKLVREWYLSYIDLLHHMCLFSAAAFLIKHCKDPAIRALSQQSTTIHEACPRCGKPLESSADASSATDGIAGGNGENGFPSSARKICKNCRRRVAICFVCHEPVTGMFVWCPGCGHGGHLEHALQWFGGLNGKAVRTVCPTGCGHRCNFVQMSTTFPRTMSMSRSETSPMDNIFSIKGHQPVCMPANTL